MSRTIKAIERHMVLRPRPAVVRSSAHRFTAEWQQRGPETLSGYAVRKLRLTFEPPQSVATATAGG